jgi:hypothetical protein
MARIRTIKPEFWTDERLTECSLSARLMFIGMLNFADDNGNMEYSAKRLKMQIFPADSIDTQPLLNELLAQGVLIEYSVNEEKFLHIKGFRKHQVINRPSATKIPQPDFIDDSERTQGAGSDGREGKGKERKRNTAPRKARATSMPDGFGISERVTKWAEGKKYTNLAPQFDAFVSYVKRKGATYVDWDEALMTAIRDDWAKVRGKPGGEDPYGLKDAL